MLIKKKTYCELSAKERFAIELTCEIIGNIHSYDEENGENPFSCINIEDLEKTIDILNIILDESEG